MCGICAILTSTPEPMAQRLRAMNAAQAHRGPDGEGLYLNSEGPHRLSSDGLHGNPGVATCGLGHRRLAVLDPESGAQPMLSEGPQPTALVYNGEIYNFPEIRRRLEANGVRFRTNTDTEILLHLYHENPDHPEAWLRELNGIFAFALWDEDRQHLLVARDPIGVKPLHIATHNNTVMMASEVKALLAAGLPAKLNRASLHAFLNIRFVPGTDTLFDGVQRLPPGHFAFAQPHTGLSTPQRFAEDQPSSTSASADRPSEVRTRFQEAVERQLISDVPVGISLSGGLDSSMMVAAAAKALGGSDPLRVADRTLRTYTLGFNEPTDENADAALIADQYKCTHHDFSLQTDVLSWSGDVIRAIEEPKINGIQGYLLAKEVSQHVKVLLGGLGGDECFTGYDIHRYCNSVGKGHAWVPPWLNRALLRPASQLLWKAQSASGMLRTEHYRIGAQIALSTGNRAGFYTRLRNAWDEDRGMYKRIYADPKSFHEYPQTASYFTSYFDDDRPYIEQVLRAEFREKMVNDFLVNEDRVTSAWGVEGRVPFLDLDFSSYARGIPAAEKMHGTQLKALWRSVAQNELPPAILAKKKQGFTFSSYHQWIKDLREQVARELTPEWCNDTGLFNHAFIQTLLDYPPHPNLRWHYFTAWMMLNVKTWMDAFEVAPH